MELNMHIHDVKAIKSINFKFPLSKGLYAITGENAAGKSTLVVCASTVFFHMSMNEYFGHPNEGAMIEFELDGAKRSWTYSKNHWRQYTSPQRMNLGGFYEGSIIFGNRFRDTNFQALRILDNLTHEDMDTADDFVRCNLGAILHDDKDYYAELFILKPEIAKENGLRSDPYFYSIEPGKYISQARMSTGENLLVSILHSLSIVHKTRTMKNDGRPYIVFLDEIELALHASALRRLVYFLQDISETLDLSIFFSTHSLELIRDIKPQNIYYLDRQMDGTITVTNPCYPAYATRSLYSDDGYGNDAVILVEDDVAKSVVERILLEKDLLTNIRIKVLPTGGWTNTLTMAHDIIWSRLLLKGTKIIVILDKDIEKEVPAFLAHHKQYKHLEPDYLPISSLEKYLKNKLVDSVDAELLRLLSNYVFQGKPLSSLLTKYKSETDTTADNNGKALYGYLISELQSIRKDREDLVEIVVKYLIEHEKGLVDALAQYLQRKIAEC